MVSVRMPWRLRLREVRERKRLTQQALADRAGMTKGNISRLETKEYRNHPKTVERLAEALGVTVDDLTYWEDAPRGVDTREQSE